MNDPAPTRPGDPARAGAALLTLVLGGLAGTAALRPRAFRTAMQEDGWVEWATFLCFFAAAALALFFVRAAKPRLEALALLGLGLFAVFVAGEEISWGQRLFGFRPPEAFLEHNYQQEANLHNLLKELLDTRWMVAAIAVSYGLLAPLAVRFTRLPAALAPAVWLVPFFAAVALLEITYPWELTGELAELGLGLVILFDVSGRLARAGSVRPRIGPIAAAASLLLSLAVVPLVDGLTLGRARALLPEAVADLEALGAALGAPEAPRSRLFKKKSVHKRVYTAREAGYLRLPAGYYLDRWNQPYWIAFQRTARGEGRLLLYSFGPNRRRDSDLDGLARADRAQDLLGGDDLGVLIPVSHRDAQSEAWSASPSPF